MVGMDIQIMAITMAPQVGMLRFAMVMLNGSLKINIFFGASFLKTMV